MTNVSRTAEYMALFRALETARSRAARLFTDPFAKRFLRPSLRFAAEAARVPIVNSAICRFVDRRWPGARTSGVARTLYIDDVVIEALRGAIRQVVILGAGFDSRAYRLPDVAGAHVFEVDRADTSRAKQSKLQRIFGVLPSHVSYVALDFDRGSLAGALQAATFNLKLPTVFLWEGVTNYLTEDAVDATFRFIATAAAGSRIIFTYIDREVLRPQTVYRDTAPVREVLRNAGELWTFGFDPPQLQHYLAVRGLHLMSDLDATAYRTRCMGERQAHGPGYEFYHVAVAGIIGASSMPSID